MEKSKILSQIFSILFPVYNEGKIIEKNAKSVYFYLKKRGFKNFEILLCDNNSTDNTREVSVNLSNKYDKIKYLYTNKKGIGAGIRLGIKSAKYDILVMISIDNAFHPKFVFDSIKILLSENADIVIGSKRHHDSKVTRQFSRKLASFIYNSLVNFIFWLGIGDTQGAVTFRKSSLMPFMTDLSSDDSFFQTQMMIYSKLHKLKIVEIPVSVVDTRASSFNIKYEAFTLIRKLIKEFWLIQKRK